MGSRSSTVDVVVWTHRRGHLLERAVDSIIRTTPRDSYNLIVICEPGGCMLNASRALAASTSRYTMLVDHDVIFYHDDWLGRMLEDFADHPDYAILTASCVDGTTRENFEAHRQHLVDLAAGWEDIPKHVYPTAWSLLYAMMIDRHRLPDAEIPQSQPGLRGVIDVDLSYQARLRHGKKCGYSLRASVFHESQDKTEYPDTEESQDASLDEKDAWLRRRWGLGMLPCTYGRFVLPGCKVTAQTEAMFDA